MAQSVKMSILSFHKHFKTITGISSLQYAKKLKLLETKCLITFENMDIEGAAFLCEINCSCFSYAFSIWHNILGEILSDIWAK